MVESEHCPTRRQGVGKVVIMEEDIASKRDLGETMYIDEGKQGDPPETDSFESSILAITGQMNVYLESLICT